MQIENSKRYKYIFSRLLFFGITTLFLLVALVPFLYSGKFWIIAVLGLGFPFLLLVEFLFLIIWIIKRSKLVFVSFFAILLSWQQVSVLVNFNFFTGNGDSVNSDTKKIRVMSWNVSTWDAGRTDQQFKELKRNLMIDFINSEDPDVICLQEFFESHAPELSSSAIQEFRKRGYTYSFFFPSSAIFEGKLEFGLVIFSKLPILKQESFLNNSMGHSEGFIYADIKIDSSVIRVFNFHTESPGFRKDEYSEKGGVKISKSILGRLKNNYQFRNSQVAFMKQHINKSPFPVIVCGDLGDVPNSFAYFHLKEGMNDAFLKKGTGLGRTYRYLSPTLRIDYLFASKDLNIFNYKRLNTQFSDHFPMVSEIEVKEK